MDLGWFLLIGCLENWIVLEAPVIGMADATFFRVESHDGTELIPSPLGFTRSFSSIFPTGNSSLLP